MDLDALTAQVLCCVEAALSVPPCHVCATAGLPSIEHCCPEHDCEGQLTVNVIQMYPADNSTLQQITRHPCRGGTLAAELGIFLSRCHPAGHGSEPPTCDELEAAAAQVHMDMGEMWRALDCCVDGDCDLPRRTVISLDVNNAGPEGGCVVIAARAIFEVTLPEPDDGGE